MEFKGTKGEWYSVFLPATKYMTERYEVHYGKDGECVAEYVHNEHDSKLIAAAPDLLEALQEMLNIFDRGIEPNTVGAKVVNKAKQAIEKALK